MSERVLVTILLPVPIPTLIAIMHGLEMSGQSDPLQTFVRQVEDKIWIYERLPESQPVQGLRKEMGEA